MDQVREKLEDYGRALLGQQWPLPHVNPAVLINTLSNTFHSFLSQHEGRRKGREDREEG